VLLDSLLSQGHLKNCFNPGTQSPPQSWSKCPRQSAAVSRPWHRSLGAGFESMQNARVAGLWRLPPQFQRNACQARLFVEQGQIPWNRPWDGNTWQLKMQSRPQEVRDAANVKHLLRKVTSSEQSQSEREAVWLAISKCPQLIVNLEFQTRLWT
jgi:hypothetical protein